MTDDVRKQFQKMGMRVRAESSNQLEESIMIMSSNRESFSAWLECQTQWRVLLGMAGAIWLGLDYQACKLVLDDLQARPHVFADLRDMEMAALPILNGAG